MAVHDLSPEPAAAGSNARTVDLLARQRAYLLPVQSRMLYYGDRPLAVARAKGDWLWDVEGNRYLDFFGGILTVSVGHANDEVVEATVQQMRTAGHTSTLYLNEITILMAEKLAADHAGPAQGVVLHEQRHRGRRDGRHGGPHLHRTPRRRLPAPRLRRAQRVDDGA
jgi:4-aminobutyrate aminotransferase-like enzyme